MTNVLYPVYPVYNRDKNMLLIYCIGWLRSGNLKLEIKYALSIRLSYLTQHDSNYDWEKCIFIQMHLVILLVKTRHTILMLCQ